MPSRQRYVVIGVFALAAICGLALAHGFEWLWGALSWVDPLPFGMRELPLTTLLGYGLALAAGFFALRHTPTRTVANEIVEELARVSWPTRQETGNATVVVITTVVVCSLYLGLFDAFWLWLTNMVLGVGVATPG
jgi:preprotein translocase SecE subunit